MSVPGGVVMADDKEQTKKEPPLKNPEVHVEVTPREKRDSSQKEYAERVKETIKKEVREKLKEAEGGGAKKQLDAAEKVADDAKTKVDPKKIQRVRIKVEGEVGPDGDKISREKTVVPKEGS